LRARLDIEYAVLSEVRDPIAPAARTVVAHQAKPRFQQTPEGKGQSKRRSWASVGS